MPRVPRSAFAIQETHQLSPNQVETNIASLVFQPFHYNAPIRLCKHLFFEIDTAFGTRFAMIGKPSCGRGGIGRRTRFRFWRVTPVKVQVLSPAPPRSQEGPRPSNILGRGPFMQADAKPRDCRPRAKVKPKATMPVACYCFPAHDFQASSIQTYNTPSRSICIMATFSRIRLA